MASNILGIGQSALMAAQAGINTTGHNIANAATPGYNRQIVIQGAIGGQNSGSGFVGKGTEVATVQRVYNEYVSNQVTSAQTSKSALDSYSAQITQVSNMLADSTSGLSPALQDFFNSVQDAASNPSDAASRQSLLSSADTLASNFQSLNGQLDEIRQGLNTQVSSSINNINLYTKQIAQLNESIDKAQGSNDGQPANDLLDQRDQAVANLSKEIKVSVVKQNNTYNVFIGNGQSVVVGNKAFDLAAVGSPSDLSRTEVGYVANGKTSILPESSLSGGTLGGLFDFRSQSLDTIQNSLGRTAIGLATTFNAQHHLGQDSNGALGGDFFSIAAPGVTVNSGNAGNAVIGATIADASALTTSDYRLQFTGGNYQVTRLSDNVQVYSASTFPATSIDGVSLSTTSGTLADGDSFVIRPTANGAAGFNVAITDKNSIAIAAPIRTAAATTNKGSGKITAGTVNAAYTPSTVTPAVSVSYDAATNTLSGFPALLPVTVTNNGTSTVFAAGTPVTYTSGATVSFGGASIALSGTPSNGDTFSIGPNSNATGDNRNALLLGALQSANTLDNHTTTYQGSYAQLVNFVGNKARELQVTSSAEGSRLSQLTQAQQGESGVNLDEEASNLLRYQQAYQAAGKVMKTASDLFDVLLSLGG